MARLSLNRELKTQAIGLALKAFTGTTPYIERFPAYTQITLSDENVKAIHAALDNAHDGPPGEVRVDTSKVWLPYYGKRYAPHIAGIVLGAIVLGFLAGRVSN